MESSLLKSLEDIVNKGIEDVIMPYVNGNRICIKHIVVRESASGWTVYNSTSHLQVAQLFCKSSAVALAKSIVEGKNNRKRIQSLDNIIQKNYNDCVFYRHTLKTSTDSLTRAITQNRFELSVTNTKKAKKSLDVIIFR
jgi:hypothetical protein